MSLLATLPLLLAGLAAAAQPSADQPIRLEVRETGSEVEFRVIGASARPVEARYVLEVTGNGNRSRQAGTASLRPGVESSLITLRLGNSAAGWKAVLGVDPQPGERYEVTRSSAGTPQ